jgi:hypothetical protein
MGVKIPALSQIDKDGHALEWKFEVFNREILDLSAVKMKACVAENSSRGRRQGTVRGILRLRLCFAFAKRNLHSG